jgi:segregation and condensation protein B
MRFGLKDVNELPSMEEFEKLVAESFQGELIQAEDAAEAQETDSLQAEEIVESAAQKK